MTSNYTTVCIVCNTKVGVTNRTNGVNFDEYYLSCGHIQKIDKKEVFKDRNIESFDTTKKRDIVNDPLDEKQATCDICGLTTRSLDELKEHKNHAHNNGNRDRRSSEQDIDPFI